jgi:hypothetical protein
MPHVSDVQPTSHADHDTLLVAALASGDLAGTDRDHATALIQTCSDCLTLHEDILAIARATTSVPPPIATRPRDFRLTPEQARRLRPAGWRRALGAFATPRLAFTRPLGIGLTTIGLAGLLLTNIPLGFGGASSAAAPASRSSSGDVTGESVGSGDGSTNLGPLAQPAASGGFDVKSSAAAASAAPAPAASAAGQAAGSPNPRGVQDNGIGTAGPLPAGSSGLVAGGAPAPSSGSERLNSTDQTEIAPSTDLRTVAFVAVVLFGLALLVLRRVGRRVTLI